MGDRGNIVVKQDASSEYVWLYTHWNGGDIHQVLQTVLRREQRWGDYAYLTRMIFCAMVKGDEDAATGFGISTTPVDNGHAFLVVDCEKRQIHVHRVGNHPTMQPALSWSFKAFCRLDFTEVAYVDDLLKPPGLAADAVVRLGDPA